MMKAKEADLIMRSFPKRTRGHLRVKAILDAASEVFAEVGYDAATTNEIAARSSTSIGSLYQFFPNKEAILFALAARYRDEVREVYAAVLTPDAFQQPMSKVISQLIDGLIKFNRSHMGYAQICFQQIPSLQVSPDLQELHLANQRSLETILAHYGPHLSPVERTLYASVGLTLVTALLSTAFKYHVASNREGVRQTLKQTKIALTAYFEKVLAREEAA